MVDFIKEQKDIQRSETTDCCKQEKELDDREAAAENEGEDRKAATGKERKRTGGEERCMEREKDAAEKRNEFLQ